MVDEPQDSGDKETEEGSEGADQTPSKFDKLKLAISTKIKPIIEDTLGDFKENFKPQILTSVLAFILFCVPFGLGVWQIQRLHWKTDLIQQIEIQQTEISYDFTVINPFQDWEALNYRKAFAAGDFMFLRSIKIKPRTLNGKVGYHLLTPLRLKDGGVIIVNRGWVPEGVNVTEEYWNAEGIDVTGILRQSKKPNSFTPENKPKNNEWYWADLNLIAKEIGVARVAPIVLHQSAQEKTENSEITYPIGGQLNMSLRNTHKMYAVTWFLLSFSLVIVWFFYSWKSPEILVAPTEGGEEDEEDEDIKPSSDNAPEKQETDNKA